MGALTSNEIVDCNSKSGFFNIYIKVHHDHGGHECSQYFIIVEKF